MNAPERIWIDWTEANANDFAYPEPPRHDFDGCEDEYIRADLHAATLARAERAEAELAKLADPNAVHVSMLAGTVAKPSWDQIKHIYAREAERAEALLAEAVEALRALTATPKPPEENGGMPTRFPTLHDYDHARATLARIQGDSHE